MNILVDTSILIALDRGRQEIRDKLAELTRANPGSPTISFITQFEFVDGIRDRTSKNQMKSRELLNVFNILPISRKTGEILAELKHSSDKHGAGLVLADLIIASQAIEHGCLLVTSDTDFTKIPELKHVLIA